jgi:hypothetical protein
VPRLQLARVARCAASSAPSPVVSDATVAIALGPPIALDVLMSPLGPTGLLASDFDPPGSYRQRARHSRLDPLLATSHPQAGRVTLWACRDDVSGHPSSPQGLSTVLVRPLDSSSSCWSFVLQSVVGAPVLMGTVRLGGAF